MATPAEPTLTFSNVAEWDAWLAKHHARSGAVLLRIPKQKGSGLTYSRALDAALAWGWIDSQKRALDASAWLQRFSPRTPKSPWSKINRARAEALMASGAMKSAGLKEVERARADGRWERAYDGSRTAEVPPELAAALAANPRARTSFDALDRANRYAILWRVQDAKKEETRTRRIEQFVALCAAGKTLHPPREKKARSATDAKIKPVPATARAPKSTSKAARYALLLRGVNVGTKNSLPMATLRGLLTRLGCTAVQTYVQSGNAVFDTTLSEAALTKAVEDALAAQMGRPIATTLRTLEELQSIVERNPFVAVATKPAYLCVTFLSHAPTKAEVAPLRAQSWEPERVEVIGRDIYSWHPNGQARSPLAVALGKLRLRGAVTTRNWNTVQKLIELLESR